MLPFQMIHKKKINKKKDLSESINLIPMINLIFLLLIFFLLTGVIQKKDTIEVNIPESSYGEKKNKERETLTIKKDGSIFWNNDEIDKEGLRDLLNSKSNLIINVDEETSIQNFNEVIKSFKSKGIKEIFINVKHVK